MRPVSGLTRERAPFIIKGRRRRWRLLVGSAEIMRFRGGRQCNPHLRRRMDFFFTRKAFCGEAEHIRSISMPKRISPLAWKCRPGRSAGGKYKFSPIRAMRAVLLHNTAGNLIKAFPWNVNSVLIAACVRGHPCLFPFYGTAIPICRFFRGV